MSITLDTTRTCVMCNLPLIVGHVARELGPDDGFEPGTWRHATCDHAARIIAGTLVAALPVTFAEPGNITLAAATSQAIDVFATWLRHHPGADWPAAAAAFDGTGAGAVFDDRLTHENLRAAFVMAQGRIERLERI